METFTEIKSFVDNPEFHKQRRNSLNTLDYSMIDTPLLDLIKDFSKLDYCFTLQCCYGHFIHEKQKDPYNIDPLPWSGISSLINYKIAYLAICIDNSYQGKKLFEHLKNIPSMNDKYIQFGCAEWFWKKQVNSYVLQVEPEQLKYHDKIQIDYEEASYIEKVRNEFLMLLGALLTNLS